MKKIICLVFLFVFAVAAYADKLMFNNYGFSIDTLAVDKNKKDSLSQTVFMFLPVEGGVFAPNVNVQIQKFEGSVDEYEALSNQQFTAAGAKIISANKKSGEIIYEYEIKLEGMDMHMYSRGLFKDGSVYLVTATALISQWGSVGNILKKNVDSFQLVK